MYSTTPHNSEITNADVALAAWVADNEIIECRWCVECGGGAYAHMPDTLHY